MMHKPKWFFYEEIHNKAKELRWETNVYLEHIFLANQKSTTLYKQNEFKLEDPFYLHKYHVLQSELAKQEYIISNINDIKGFLYQNKTYDINKIVLRILPLDPNEIYLVSDCKDKSDCLLSMPQYIKWITLYENSGKENSNILQNIYLKNIIEKIHNEIFVKILSQWLHIRWINYSCWILGRNITIESIGSNTIYLCCTDIGWSIDRIVKLNEEFVNSLLYWYSLNKDKINLIREYTQYLRDCKNVSDQEFINLVFWDKVL